MESSQRQSKQGLTSIYQILERAGCKIGDEVWWSQIRLAGTPFVLSSEGDIAQVIFLWREPKRESMSRVKQVYIDINGVTDHHSFDMAKLTQLDGTDVWFYIDRLKSTWRGGYAFIPVPEHLVQPSYTGDHAEKKAQHREWIRAIFPLSCQDEFNRHSLHHCAWGQATSPIHMPHAPVQKEWHSFDSASGQCHTNADATFQWHSRILDNRRDIWVYSTAVHTSRPLPLVLLLDGRFWSHSLPIYDALRSATREGKVPEAVYVLIDEVNGQQRGKDLSCNRQFWQAITQELIPQIEQTFSVTQDPRRTVVVGQSLGGLSAMFAALNWPERFGSVVCQSGSFWWPDASMVKPPSEYTPPTTANLICDMSQKIHAGLGVNVHLNIFMEVGSGEDIMVDLSQDVYNQLVKQQHNIRYRVFDGGHDRLCWRGGIIDGLSYVLA